jgi:hypothetical protein
MKFFKHWAILGAAVGMTAVAVYGQKIETVDGIRLVHNEKGGLWAGSPKVKLELVRTIGGLEEKDPNLAFGAPYDVVRDAAGNIFVLDSNRRQVQKLDSEGKYLLSIGRSGQGPGEFQMPNSMDIDEAALLFIHDAMGRKIEVMTSEGRPLNTVKLESFGFHTIRRLSGRRFVKGGALLLKDLEGSRKLPKLLSIVDRDGRTLKSFCDPKDYDDANVNSHANNFLFEKDARENIYVNFMYQNRVDKYDAEAKLVWRADRPLSYGTDVIDKGLVRRDEKGTGIQAPTMNMVSYGIAVDGAGRIWANTFDRQMKPEEKSSTVSVGGTIRRVKEGKIGIMDIHKLEIFDPDGALLGAIPLHHLVHGLRIFGDTLFIWDRENAAVYQYRIVEIP